MSREEINSLDFEVETLEMIKNEYTKQTNNDPSFFEGLSIDVNFNISFKCLYSSKAFATILKKFVSLEMPILKSLLERHQNYPNDRVKSLDLIISYQNHSTF